MTQSEILIHMKLKPGGENDEAFERTLEREIPHLQRYALSLARDQWQADDLVQDCLLRAIRKRRQFRAGTHMRRWLFTILRNLHLDARRQYARRGPHLALEELRPETGRRPPEEDLMALMDLGRAQKKLRPCDRQVLYLSAFSGLSHKDIARRLGIAEGTVRSRLSRSRATLAG